MAEAAQNTGYKHYATLTQLDSSGNPTGVTKPNDPADPDYIAPVMDTSFCPTDTEGPVFSGKLLFSNITSSSMTVNWGVSDNVGITEQRVMWRSANTTVWTTVYKTETARDHDITGLQQNTYYYVKVIAEDAAGNSTTSEISYISTKPSITLYNHYTAYSTMSGDDACVNFNNGNYTIRYTNSSDFIQSSEVYDTNNSSDLARAGYYSNGMEWLYFTGTSVNQFGMCGGDPNEPGGLTSY